MSSTPDRPLVIPTFPTKAARMAVTPSSGELVSDAETLGLYFGDGRTAGGIPVADRSRLVGIPFAATGKITSAAAATPVILLADAQVPATKKAWIDYFLMWVTGATAWTDATATKLSIEDTNGSPVVSFDIAKSALTGSAGIRIGITGVTHGAAFTAGGGMTAGKGVQIVGDANFAAGSDIFVYVRGFLI